MTCIVAAASFGRPLTASLKAICTVNLPLPRCSAGAFATLAVSAARTCRAGVSFVTAWPENAATAAPPPEARKPPVEGGA